MAQSFRPSWPRQERGHGKSLAKPCNGWSALSGHDGPKEEQTNSNAGTLALPLQNGISSSRSAVKFSRGALAPGVARGPGA